MTQYAFTGTATPSDNGTAIATWAWDFGDGNTSSLQNPTNDYTIPGVYNASLTVTDDTGCVLTDTFQVIIQPEVDCDGITATASETHTDRSFSFQGEADLSASASSITSWDWDFGDGSAHGTTQNPNHDYTTNGVYTVVLTVTDNVGCSAFDELVVIAQVGCDGVFAFITEEHSEFDYTFTGEADPSDNATTIVTWDWDFGDGSPHGTVQNPTHSYTEQGTYVVVLLATDDNGCIARAEIEVYAQIGCDATRAELTAFWIDETTIGADATASTGVAPLSFEWRLDGGPWEGSGAMYTFTTTPGDHIVGVKVTDSTTPSPCIDTDSAPVREGADCTDFVARLEIVEVAGHGVRVNVDNSEPAGADFVIDWGDGGNDTSGVVGASDPHDHLYTDSDPDDPTITLFLMNGETECASMAQTLTLPGDCFIVSPEVSGVVDGLDVTLTVSYGTNCPFDSVDRLVIDWDFGDGNTTSTTGMNPFTHTYANPGVYTVTATITDACGCQSPPLTTSVSPAALVPLEVSRNYHGQSMGSQPATIWATLTLYPDGTTEVETANNVGGSFITPGPNWFVPTIGAIGASYEVKPANIVETTNTNNAGNFFGNSNWSALSGPVSYQVLLAAANDFTDYTYVGSADIVVREIANQGNIVTGSFSWALDISKAF